MKFSKLNAVAFILMIMICCFALNCSSDELNYDSEDPIVQNDRTAEDNNCCPPDWTIFDLSSWPEDPAFKWDINGDGFVCFRGAWLGDDTPQGEGNDPLLSQSVVKDNNQPCPDD